MASLTKLRTLANAFDAHRFTATDFIGADLRGADLSAKELSGFSLRGADLSGANLAGAHFTLVDLAGAQLDGANLETTRFTLVDLSGARLEGAALRGAHWTLVDLSDARLEGADLSEALLKGSVAERACFDEVRAAHSRLVHSDFDDASFRGADLLWANTAGSSFRGAVFEGARRFFLCREILVEVLRGAIEGDFERASLIGAIVVEPDLCYPEWRNRMESNPAMRDLALRIFDQYPDSGFQAALRDGWTPSKLRPHAG